jgi:hypothetical protein
MWRGIGAGKNIPKKGWSPSPEATINSAISQQQNIDALSSKIAQELRAESTSQTALFTRA